LRDDMTYPDYRVVIITLDQHTAGPIARLSPKLAADFPGLRVDVFASAEWENDPSAMEAAVEAVGKADILIGNLVFLEDQLNAIVPAMRARRDHCDAFVGVIADPSIVELTRMGDLDMSKPASGPMAMLKKLRGAKSHDSASGAKKMKMLKRLPKILRLIPGKAQDLRTWFLCMQYWLGGSDENIEQMMRMLISRYSNRAEWNGISVCITQIFRLRGSRPIWLNCPKWMGRRSVS